MENLMSPMEMLRDTTPMDVPQLTISPADTSLDASPPAEVKVEETKTEEKKPVKKRKSWGQELPTPKTNLPPRKRAKTEDEKEQRRIERVLRNRAAAQTSRERKRLEVEKLEGEKQRMEQQNQFLLQRLAQMEAENNRLNRQVAQLSAEIRGSRGTTPMTTIDTASPTLTPTLFKQEGEDFTMDKIPFPTPSISDYSPSLKLEDLAESSDMTQHPAAVLCDLQCQSKESKDLPLPTHSSLKAFQMVLLQLLFLTMTSAAYSTVILPLSQILNSMKAGSPLTFSTEETYRHLPLIHWLISTPTLSSSSTRSSTPRSVFRMRVLTRLLACSPALARPLRDATGKALQLAVEAATLRQTRSEVGDVVETTTPSWESLLTMAWAIDSIRLGRYKVTRAGRDKRVLKSQHKIMKRTSMRSFRSYGKWASSEAS
ncbi:bZIP transcription factor HacA [Talaromyces stipitatus ATCC 10500]|uniref:BZIP transcription factor HacA n=1 Tax=Talaromyces stipitatus (strain ATCC 10500 / CBS 375.48 / QM 6759 / NRRL 1006) TaxID=441959 RepID=B8MNW8_TALSN|nr:bZIP transcription factor HacA [Talaromyces stipitatus ATCC 10500]EED14207.1 bZIP transcription factor HacA [Talaromyces stipitatus ATCC 10500]